MSNSDTDIIFQQLRAPFNPMDIEWRIGQAGKTADGKIWAKVLAYLTSRAVMDRLDEVMGISGWKPEYLAAPNDPEGKSLICRLSLRINGEWITKEDGASNSDIEPIKGGISDSLKRAAVLFGIGRYLYDLGDQWAQVFDSKQTGSHYANCKIKVKGQEEWAQFHWLPPELPQFALPEGVTARGQQKPQQQAPAPKANGKAPADTNKLPDADRRPPKGKATGKWTEDEIYVEYCYIIDLAPTAEKLGVYTERIQQHEKLTEDHKRDLLSRVRTRDKQLELERSPAMA